MILGDLGIPILSLKEAGIDVEAWFNELFDENGNFKKPEEVSL